MKRRTFLKSAAGAAAPALWAQPPAPIPEPHFPSRLYQFVWRNWELANAGRMAAVVKTEAKSVLDIGRSMGLPGKPRLSEEQLRRIYVTAIRQNWHLLPFEQLMELLGWSREKLEFTLKEDDFRRHPRPPVTLMYRIGV
ncbi:MAG: hypothetical protein WD696_06855 [Bryobacteraceae bacterium]